MQSLKSVFTNRQSQLATLLQRAMQLNQMTDRLRNHLPQFSQLNFSITKIEQGVMTLSVPSAAEAMSVRFSAPQIQASAQTLFPNITAIIVKVTPDEGESSSVYENPLTTPPQPISANVAENLSRVASTLTDDDEDTLALKASLERLSKQYSS